MGGGGSLAGAADFIARGCCQAACRCPAAVGCAAVFTPTFIVRHMQAGVNTRARDSNSELNVQKVGFKFNETFTSFRN